MALSEQEKQIILYGKANGRTKEQVLQSLANYRAGRKVTKTEPSEPQEKTLAVTDKIEQLKESTGIPTAKRIVGDIKERVGNIKEAFARQESFPMSGDGQTALETGLQTAGQVVGAVTDIGGRIAEGLFKTTVTPSMRAKVMGNATIQEGLELASKGIAAYEDWKVKNPRLAADLEAVVNIGSFIPIGAGAKYGIVGTEKAIQTGTKAVETGVETAVKGARAVGNTVETGIETAKKGAELASTLTESASDIVRRIPTNLEAKLARQTEIKALPTQTAKIAVRDGVDIGDVKKLSIIAQTKDPQAKKLIDIAKKIQAGEAESVQALDIIGEPIIKKFDETKKQLKEVGKQLGVEKKKLGVVTQEELIPSVFGRLKEVKGLEGLTEKNGILNFKNTTLSTTANKSIRKEIQDLYTRATRWGSGENKDLLRQEIFEILGGKKKGLSEITETGDKSLEAIRSGLFDVLSKKNKKYAELSTQFAKLRQPITDLEKYLDLSDLKLADDLRNLEAGILVRRITSNAKSGSDIRRLFRELGVEDQAGELQDLYNILEQYINITQKTSLRGQVQPQVDLSPTSIAGKAIKEVAGQTKDVTQKALYDLLDELFSAKTR